MDVDTNRFDLLSEKISNISASLQEMKEFNILLDQICSDENAAPTDKNTEYNIS